MLSKVPVCAAYECYVAKMNGELTHTHTAKRLASVCVGAFLTTMAIVSPSTPAQADGGTAGTETGGDVSGPGDEVPADVQAQSRAKMAGVKNWWSVDADFQPQTRLMLESPTVSSKFLYALHYDQIKSYYCGPASGKMILRERNEGSSEYNGDIQDQPHIANEVHMRTDINGKTAWGTGFFRVGLNRWIFGTNDGFYVTLDSPSTSEFKHALWVDIQNNNTPFGADTVEFADGVHYNGHPKSKTIGHWIVADGFGEHGDRTYFKDPATSIYPADAAFDAGTSAFVNTFLQTNGITW